MHSACLQVVASKDLVIKEFHAQLKDKDDAYVKLLKQQQEDIALLLDRMHEVRRRFCALATRSAMRPPSA